MSRTIEVEKKESPVRAHVFFNGSLGKFSVLRGGEDSELQEISYPFPFVVLDTDTHKVGGKFGGIEKNAIKFKSTLGHPKYGRSLKVWLENEPQKILAEGTWGEIKNKPELSDARFTALIFVITDFGEGKEVACIHLHGRAYSAWLNATKGINPCGDISFVVKRTEQMTGGKGATSLVPVFEIGNVSTETIKLAQQADFNLQMWLSAQFDSQASRLGISAAGSTRSNAAKHGGSEFLPEEELAPIEKDDPPF
jgi:hypothetical protein